MNLLEPRKQERIFQTKPRSSIPNEIKESISTIALDEKGVIPFGSWTYKSQLYPADIDLVEQDYKCCSKEEAVKYYVKHLQRIVETISDKRGYYLGDIKAGLDYTFLIDIGELQYNKQGKSRLVGYDPNFIREEFMKLNENGLMSNEEATEFFNMVHDNISADDFEILRDTLREKWLLRWNKDEMLRGYKILPGNRQKSLEEAIQDPTFTKIDMWKLIFGRFLEITDVYALYWTDENGNTHLLNKTNDIENLAQDLKKEVQKYAFSNKFFKPFKMAKRIWSIARMTKDIKTASLITPFMQSDVGRLSQIGSDIETLVTMLESLEIPPLPSILTEIDGFKLRLSNVYEINFEEEAIDETLNKITSIDKNDRSKSTIHFIIESLSGIKKYIKELVEKYTVKYLSSVGLYPPPQNYLP